MPVHKWTKHYLFHSWDKWSAQSITCSIALMLKRCPCIRWSDEITLFSRKPRNGRTRMKMAMVIMWKGSSVFYLPTHNTLWRWSLIFFFAFLKKKKKKNQTRNMSSNTVSVSLTHVICTHPFPDYGQHKITCTTGAIHLHKIKHGQPFAHLRRKKIYDHSNITDHT